MTDDSSVASIFMSIRASLARAITGIVPPKDIEDIVQETYVKVCQVDVENRIRSPRSLLYRTARNLALDHIKRAESRLVSSTEDSEEAGHGQGGARSDDTLDAVTSREEFSAFCDAVRHLPLQCRRAFVLKKVYGYSQREIARELGLSESTVEKHIAEGVKRCMCFMLRHGHYALPDASSVQSGSRRQGGRA